MYAIVCMSYALLSCRTSSDFTIKQLNLRDKVASQHHMEVRERARLNGNELQMALLRQRSEEANRNK